MAGIIKFYDWKIEQRYMHVDSPKHLYGPVVGRLWHFFPAGPKKGTSPYVTHITQGRVTHFNRENGVVLTDAGEILMRG